MRYIKKVPQRYNVKFKVLDLFSGAGGFSYGFEKNLNFETVLSTDYNKDALLTLGENIKGSEIIFGDITDRTIRRQIVQRSLELGVNVVIGGPPCQGFSLKGKKLGMDDPRNFLFLEFYKIVSELKPEVFVIENVKNLVHALEGYFINQIKDRFESLGYFVNYGILNSKDFRVPQRRERSIIIGSLSKNINLPSRIESSLVTVRDAISDLSYLEANEGEFRQDYKLDATSSYQIEMRHNSSHLYNHISTNHSDLAIKKLKMIPPEGNKSSLPKELLGRQKFNNTWSRLVWNELSPTIDTRFDTPSNGKNSHPYLNRAITPREAARLQSFDDSFLFLGKKTQICKQIGNAVPPRLALAIANKISDSYKDNSFIDDNYKLYNDDAFRILKELINNDLKVSHIITDPPYNISKKNNFSTMRSPRKGVDFGDWDSDFDLLGWIRGYSSLLDKNGSFIIFCSYIFLSFVVRELEQSNIEVKDILIWKKSNPMPRNIERRYVQDMEFAVWGVKKGAKWAFNKPSGVKYLRSIYESSTVSGKEKIGHPTQKSLTVMSDIIKIHTNKGDTILDPFMGSGTTGVAAISNERNFIGIELSEDYFNMAKQRILQFGVKK